MGTYNGSNYEKKQDENTSSSRKLLTDQSLKNLTIWAQIQIESNSKMN
jgi:hypothetical protein